MCALDARPDAVQIGRVRVRGPADALRARRRLEASVADLSPAALGLPPRAVLVVRRVEPSARLPMGRSARTDGFGRAVRDALRRQAASARRPWLHADAAAAEAVWFADEAELAACVVRDALRGAVAERWWWRNVLGPSSADIWLRAHVLARGEVLVPVLALLAQRGDAVAWATRLSAPEAEWAADAVVRAYGLEVAEAVHEPAPAPRQGPPVVDARHDALAQVLDAVPEARDITLAAPQRRMLTVALAVAREPVWARSAQLATALRTLDEDTPLELAASPAALDRGSGEVDAVSPRVSLESDAVPVDREMDSEPFASPLPQRRMMPADASSDAMDGATDGVGDGEAVHHLPSRRPTSRRRDAARSRKDDGFAAATTDAPDVASGIDITSTIQTDTPAPAAPALSDAVDSPRADVGEVRVAEARKAEDVPNLDLTSYRSVETEFGGIFYLLNAALALELYGDFTMPRAKGLALLPWDLLAMIGRAWFGAEFLADPVWRALAALAGRSAKEPPGAYFHPPKEWMMPAGWLAPWGEVDEVRVHATRVRLRVLHPAGFAVCDLPRDPTLRPMTQARALCAAYPRLRGATLLRARGAGRIYPRAAVARWLAWLLDFLAARLARALYIDKVAEIPALLCRHPARLAVSASAVDVHLSLADLPLPVRVAGLDRDAGWIPAAGRSLSFHFS